MKAIVYHGPGNKAWEEVAMPTIKEDTDAIVRVLLEGRKKTRPIIVFLTVMTAVLGLAFVLENMRPRVRPIASTEDEEADERRRRRSA